MKDTTSPDSLDSRIHQVRRTLRARQPLAQRIELVRERQRRHARAVAPEQTPGS